MYIFNNTHFGGNPHPGGVLTGSLTSDEVLAMPESTESFECPQCFGEGFYDIDIVDYYCGHDTKEVDCSCCGGTGEVKLERLMGWCNRNHEAISEFMIKPSVNTSRF